LAKGQAKNPGPRTIYRRNFKRDKTARLILDDVEYEFPVVTGTEGERAIDISR